MSRSSPVSQTGRALRAAERNRIRESGIIHQSTRRRRAAGASPTSPQDLPTSTPEPIISNPPNALALQLSQPLSSSTVTGDPPLFLPGTPTNEGEEREQYLPVPSSPLSSISSHVFTSEERPAPPNVSEADHAHTPATNTHSASEVLNLYEFINFDANARVPITNFDLPTSVPSTQTSSESLEPLSSEALPILPHEQPTTHQAGRRRQLPSFVPPAWREAQSSAPTVGPIHSQNNENMDPPTILVESRRGTTNGHYSETDRLAGSTRDQTTPLLVEEQVVKDVCVYLAVQLSPMFSAEGIIPGLKLRSTTVTVQSIFSALLSHPVDSSLLGALHSIPVDSRGGFWVGRSKIPVTIHAPMWQDPQYGFLELCRLSMVESCQMPILQAEEAVDSVHNIRRIHEIDAIIPLYILYIYPTPQYSQFPALLTQPASNSSPSYCPSPSPSSTSLDLHIRTQYASHVRRVESLRKDKESYGKTYVSIWEVLLVRQLMREVGLPGDMGDSTSQVEVNIGGHAVTWKDIAIWVLGKDSLKTFRNTRSSLRKLYSLHQFLQENPGECDALTKDEEHLVKSLDILMVWQDNASKVPTISFKKLLVRTEEIVLRYGWSNRLPGVSNVI